MARNTERLELFYETLKQYHKKYVPDWRFGQLIVNIERWLDNKGRNSDLFYYEEDDFLNILDEFLRENSWQVGSHNI